MYELSQIILWILWTLRPAMAVEANLIDIIASGFGMFADDEELLWLSAHPANSATIAAAFADSHAQLDLLIYLRACEIAGIRPGGNGFIPNRNAPGSRHSPETCWRIFRRLVIRFEDRERLAHLRAQRLRRERDENPLNLIDHTMMIRDLHKDHAIIIVREVLHRRRRGRWHARACAHDGEGCATARGPPHNTTADCPFPTASRVPRARTPPHALIPERRHLLARRQ